MRPRHRIRSRDEERYLEAVDEARDNVRPETTGTGTLVNEGSVIRQRTLQIESGERQAAWLLQRTVPRINHEPLPKVMVRLAERSLAESWSAWILER